VVEAAGDAGRPASCADMSLRSTDGRNFHRYTRTLSKLGKKPFQSKSEQALEAGTTKSKACYAFSMRLELHMELATTSGKRQLPERIVNLYKYESITMK